MDDRAFWCNDIATPNEKAEALPGVLETGQEFSRNLDFTGNVQLQVAVDSNTLRKELERKEGLNMGKIGLRMHLLGVRVQCRVPRHGGQAKELAEGTQPRISLVSLFVQWLEDWRTS